MLRGARGFFPRAFFESGNRRAPKNDCTTRRVFIY